MNSLNHYAYGSVCEALVSRIAGLMPESPGWDMARIQPHPGARHCTGWIWLLNPRAVGLKSAGAWEGMQPSRCPGVPQGVRARVILPDGTAYQDISGDFRFRCAPLPALVHPFDRTRRWRILWKTRRRRRSCGGFCRAHTPS